MVSSVQSGGPVPMIPQNKIEERLDDTLDLGPANKAARSDSVKTEIKVAEKTDDFADYLNEASVTLLVKAQDGNRFDPAAAITENSVYKTPADKTII